MCECKENMRKYLIGHAQTEVSGINHIYYDISNIGSLGGRGVRKTGQRIEVGKWWINKKGERKEKIEKSFIAHDYCPWCAEKYDKK